MSTPRLVPLVEKIAYPVCILSLVVLVPSVVAGVWIEIQDEVLWKIAGSSGILAFSSALALSATRAVKGPK